MGEQELFFYSDSLTLQAGVRENARIALHSQYYCGAATMRAFEPYVRKLQALVRRAALSNLTSADHLEVTAILDGQPGAILRKAVPLKSRRASGAFFTGTALARKAIPGTALRCMATAQVLDPACGVGDLLVRCANFLPVKGTMRDTLESWGTRLHGYDLHKEFVHSTQARLALLALQRGAKPTRQRLPRLSALLPGIRVRDGVAELRRGTTATHIVMNPPFTTMDAPAECDWASGKITMAAVFMTEAVRYAAPGTRILAILPDVLRSGSRYSHWRSFVERHAKIESVEVIGRFDPWADVDVFAVSACVRNPADWGFSRLNRAKTVGDVFSVHVGAVVPFRDPKRGPRRAYLTVPMLAPWTTYHAVGQYRKYAKRTFKPPFVVVRRTSRPDDRYRAVGTIVIGGRQVAVENHLLVLKPYNGSLGRCRDLLKVLRSSQTNAWFNQRIRCRHLTVTALRDLPWREKA